MSDSELERRLLRVVANESTATAEVVALIAAFEARRLYAPRSFPSMFEYCTELLGYSRGAAFLRIYAGRLSRAYPEILDLLRERRLHLTAIRTIGPHLNESNRGELLARCVAKTERELQFLVTEIAPKPEIREVVRALPTPERDAAPPPDFEAPAAPIAPPPREKTEPMTPTRVRFAFTGTKEFFDRVERAKELLKRRHPSGSLEEIFSTVVEFYLRRNDPALKSRAAPQRDTDPRARRPPRWVQDLVRRRDGNRCSFVSSTGKRCGARGGLEFDHARPWALGGASNEPDNVRLLCRAHNALAAEKFFGARK